MHRASSRGEPASVRMRRLTQGGGATFFLAYVLFMIPTYVLPYFGSNSILANGLSSTLGLGLLPQFWLHALALYSLIVICWIRGTRIETPWLAVFPALAALFDLVPTLNWIPLIPTACHVAALVIGVSRPAVTGRPMAKIVVGSLGFLAITAYGLIAPSPQGAAEEASSTELSSETESLDLTSEGALESDSADASKEATQDDVTLFGADASESLVGAPIGTPSPTPAEDSLEVATLKALNSSQAASWGERGRYGTVTPGSLAEITGGICRTVLVADETQNRSEESTWCRDNQGIWAKR